MALSNFLQRSRHACIEQHLLVWLQGFAGVVDGLVTVFTLGFFVSQFELTLCCWRTKLYFNQQIKAKQNIKD